MGFEPKIPVFERAKTVHASDREATVIGCFIGTEKLKFTYYNSTCLLGMKYGLSSSLKERDDVITLQSRKEDDWK
jgi:hypothetical protein